MKKLRSLIILLSGVSILLLAPFSNVSADVNDFSFTRFEGEYHLSKDSDGRSQLKVTETFTADFPNFDQNKGVERLIPNSYDGHTTSFEFVSLKRNGVTEPVYSQEKRGTDIIIATGTDEYVQGSQTYELVYTLRDVIKTVGSHQEFYWDTVGTSSKQAFGSVRATVTLDDSIAGNLNGDISCYEGAYGKNDECSSNMIGDDTAVFYSTGRLNAGENVTMALGFNEGTFSEYSASVQETIFGIVAPIAAVGLGLLALISAFITWWRHGRDAPGRGTIVPQYLPPKDRSILDSAGIYPLPRNVISAQLIDLAVRHKIQLIEKEKKTLFGGTKKKYSISLQSLDGMRDDERNVIAILFGSAAKIGDIAVLDDIAKRARWPLTKAQQNAKKVHALKDGYRLKAPTSKLPLVVAGIALVPTVAAFVWYVGFSHADWSVAVAVACVAGWPLLMTIVPAMLFTQPLTAKGAEARDYLLGLKQYIKVAESERLKILQSPQGAEKTPVDTDDTAQLVKLYERVLPYAILFGKEKEWGKALEAIYATASTQPDWYSGTSAFSPAQFHNSVAAFSGAVKSSLSPSDGSSSTGGAGGGGFSGGGGGGGGFGGR